MVTSKGRSSSVHNRHRERHSTKPNRWIKFKRPWTVSKKSTENVTTFLLRQSELKDKSIIKVICKRSWMFTPTYEAARVLIHKNNDVDLISDRMANNTYREWAVSEVPVTAQLAIQRFLARVIISIGFLTTSNQVRHRSRLKPSFSGRSTNRDMSRQILNLSMACPYQWNFIN